MPTCFIRSHQPFWKQTLQSSYITVPEYDSILKIIKTESNGSEIDLADSGSPPLLVHLYHSIMLLSTINGQHFGLEREVTNKFYNILFVSSKIVSQSSTGRCLEIQFWKRTECCRPCYHIRVEVPHFWTPQMYLAALLTMLASSDKMVVFKMQSCLCPAFEITTINNISSAFFGFTLHEIVIPLICPALCVVQGGVMWTHYRFKI